jgi:hypothetical protein
MRPPRGVGRLHAVGACVARASEGGGARHGLGRGRAGQAEVRRWRGRAREELGCFGQQAESEVVAR